MDESRNPYASLGSREERSEELKQGRRSQRTFGYLVGGVALLIATWLFGIVFGAAGMYVYLYVQMLQRGWGP